MAIQRALSLVSIFFPARMHVVGILLMPMPMLPEWRYVPHSNDATSDALPHARLTTVDASH